MNRHIAALIVASLALVFGTRAHGVRLWPTTIGVSRFS